MSELYTTPLTEAEVVAWAQVPEDLQQAQTAHAKMAGRWLLATSILAIKELALQDPDEPNTYIWPEIDGGLYDLHGVAGRQITDITVTHPKLSTEANDTGFQVQAKLSNPKEEYGHLTIGAGSTIWSNDTYVAKRILARPGEPAIRGILAGGGGTTSDNALWNKRVCTALRTDTIAGMELFGRVAQRLKDPLRNPELIKQLGSYIQHFGRS